MFSESTILVFSGRTNEPDDIARMLADRYRVIEAEDAADGLGHLSNSIDVIVADLEAAGQSALELLQRWKSQKPQTPFLALIHHADVGAAVEAMKLGATDCIVKPVKPEKLQATVSGLIESSRSGSDSDRQSKQKSQIDIPPGTSLEDLERAAVEQALTQHQGNRTHAAKTLGISVRTLQRKLKAWGIPIVSSPPSMGSSSSFILPTTGGHSPFGAHVHSAH